MLAKRFFFVCAGILCLALAYHFGATSAGAQGTTWRVVGDNLVVSGNALYLRDGNGWTPVDTGPVPPSQVVSGWWGGGLQGLSTDSGEGWVYFNNGSGRHDIGLIPGATPTSRVSFGQLKARYR
jgi:hypothetical protein